MKRSQLLAAIPTALLIYGSFVGSANAIVVNEGAGDFPDSIPGPADEFVLTPGLNLISGNSSTPGGGGASDFDDFILTIPTGYFLEQMWFFWDATVAQNVTSFETTFTMQGQSPSSVDVTLFSSNASLEDTSPIVNMFSVPIAAGSYLLNQLSLSIISNPTAAAADFDYIWKFKVTPVPLPPAAWLLVSGLLAMVGLSRRQRAA